MVSLPGDEVVQGGSYSSRYTGPLLYEHYIVHGPSIVGVKHAISHGFTSNHTQDMLNCHPIFLIGLESGISTMCVVSLPCEVVT